ncbi:flagellar protein FliT [Pusillimonas sp. CC-YST705]|uniref:Flagellar protein FliT n=1 Tax=Mesopusillimonas faecipullorum TaxID=2755040 RepID=A0ABS8C9Y4_9BURK|nr:flagellar protein FliT [Mesopusillimonas faecipullorum]MCB5362841.1 flagellar protein FliT [Mesopusillimonas faecipullorum]
MPTITPRNADPGLRCYEHLAELSGKMLELAQNHDWSGVITLSQQYRDAVEALREVSGPDVANPQARQILLTKILHDDALLRELAMPELARLGHMMGSLKRQQSLHQAYGPHQAS